MNTNTTIPTIDVESTALAIEWTDGVGTEHRVAFEVPEHENRAQLATDIFNCMRHVFLMGADEVRQVLHSVEDQRDALADSLEQANAMHAELERRLSDAQAGIVTIGDAGLAEQVRKQMVELHQHGYSEGMGDVDSGPSWDADDPRAVMYNIGRQARIGDAETGQRIEALIGQVAALRDSEAAARRLAEERGRRIEQMEADFAHINEGLNEQAAEHRLCDQYEASIDGINDGTRILKLVGREREYTITVSVEQDVDYTPVDAAARAAGFSDSYDYSARQTAEMDYYFTVMCSPFDIEAKTETLRRAIYGVSGVNSATASYDEV